jgi:putative methyltransferase (TIGR04325 family)
MAIFLTRLLRKRSKYIYKDFFMTREDANLNLKSNSNYGSKSYDSRAIKNLKFSEKYTQGRDMIVPLVLSILNKNKCTILDIGGGVNAVFSHLSELQKSQYQCLVLERAEIIQSLNGKVSEKHGGYIQYIDSIDFVTTMDIAYFGSSIQYIEDYELLLNKISMLSPQFIIFSESIFTKSTEDYFVLQVNMFPNIFPNRFVSEKKLTDLMDGLNYKCTYNKAVPGDFSHETIKRNSYDCKTLVFKRNIDT